MLLESVAVKKKKLTSAHDGSHGLCWVGRREDTTDVLKPLGHAFKWPYHTYVYQIRRKLDICRLDSKKMYSDVPLRRMVG